MEYRSGRYTSWRSRNGKRGAGSAALRTSQRDRKPKIREDDLQRLKAEIEAHPDKTPGELKEELKLPCSESRLSRIVREKLGVRCNGIKAGHESPSQFLICSGRYSESRLPDIL